MSFQKYVLTKEPTAYCTKVERQTRNGIRSFYYAIFTLKQDDYLGIGMSEHLAWKDAKEWLEFLEEK